MPLFPLIAAGCFFVVGLGVGYMLRWLLGQSRLALALLVFGALTPWLAHHLEILRVTRDTLPASASFPLEVALIGPVIVLTATIAVVAAPHWLRFIAVTMPGTAFLTTWFLTFSLARRAVSSNPFPSDHLPFDNMATIWLWILSFGATSGLVAYCWPLRPRRHSLSR